MRVHKCGNVGIGNTSPWVDLNLCNVAVSGSSGSQAVNKRMFAFGKNNGGGGTKDFKMGMSSHIFFCIGDCGNVR
jgi:hypothetical protein